MNPSVRTCAVLIVLLFGCVAVSGLAWSQAKPAAAGAAGEATEGAALSYVGAKKCKVCHSSEKMAGLAYKIWSEEKHAKAFESLKSEKALEAAKKMGIDNPSADPKCLKCHVTDASIQEEGVSCERCHGMASKWLTPHGKKKDPPSHEVLVKMGMTDLTKPEDRVALCMQCHGPSPDNPFYKEFNYDECWAKINHGKGAQGAAAEGAGGDAEKK